MTATATATSSERVSFQTTPERYRHWQLELDGLVRDDGPWLRLLTVDAGRVAAHLERSARAEPRGVEPLVERLIALGRAECAPALAVAARAPGLGAATQVLKDIGVAPEQSALPSLGYAVAYPFGILGILSAMMIVPGSMGCARSARATS